MHENSQFRIVKVEEMSPESSMYFFLRNQLQFKLSISRTLEIFWPLYTETNESILDKKNC